MRAGTKILFVFDGAELGGAERQGLHLASYLRDHYGADIQIWGLGADRPGRVAQLCAARGLAWHAAPFSSNVRSCRYWMLLLSFLRCLRKQTPDAIIAYTWRPNVTCGLLWRLSGARTFLWNQRDEGLGLDHTLLHRLAARLTLQYVANSQGAYDFLRRSYGIKTEQCSTIHNGISLPPPSANRAAFRRDLNIPEHAMLACMLGNLHRNKDHTTLIHAWRIVVDSYPQAAVLVLAGRQDETAESLKTLIKKLELTEHVLLCGELENVENLLFAADLYVHSALSEGSPNGVLEAMAAGLPVVATNIPGIAEALGETQEDCLAEVGDIATLAQKVLQMMNDKQLRERKVVENKQRIRDHFSLTKMGEAYARILG